VTKKQQPCVLKQDPWHQRSVRLNLLVRDATWLLLSVLRVSSFFGRSLEKKSAKDFTLFRLEVSGLNSNATSMSTTASTSQHFDCQARLGSILANKDETQSPTVLAPSKQ
jgi:hypothetical protein